MQRPPPGPGAPPPLPSPHPLLALEHSVFAWRVDVAFYAFTSAALLLVAVALRPPGSGLLLLAWVGAGLAGWTLAEYLLHRFVLHRVPPFDRWHARHHQRPTALIGSPTLLSGSLFVLLAAVPAAWMLGVGSACALLAGLTAGYLAYGLSHNAMHRALTPGGRRTAWLLRRMRWHALHHRSHQVRAGHFGVTTSLWDHAFGTAKAPG